MHVFCVREYVFLCHAGCPGSKLVTSKWSSTTRAHWSQVEGFMSKVTRMPLAEPVFSKLDGMRLHRGMGDLNGGRCNLLSNFKDASCMKIRVASAP